MNRSFGRTESRRASARTRRWAVRLGGAAGAVGAVGLAALVMTPSTVLAATSTATVTGGALGFVTPPADFAFPTVVLSGVDQTTSVGVPMDVGDNTGTAAGWNVTMTSTLFTGAGSTHPTLAAASTAVLVAPPDATCDISVACTPATNGVTYPYALPAALTAPTATIVVDAAAGSGMGDQTVTPTFRLLIPARTMADTYTSTWTIATVSGP
jgi:hypothetical protein